MIQQLKGEHFSDFIVHRREIIIFQISGTFYLVALLNSKAWLVEITNRFKIYKEKKHGGGNERIDGSDSVKGMKKAMKVGGEE